MLRLIKRAGMLFGAYAGLLLAVVVAGFLGAAVGIWASVIWGVALLLLIVLLVRRRQPRPNRG